MGKGWDMRKTCTIAYFTTSSNWNYIKNVNPEVVLTIAFLQYLKGDRVEILAWLGGEADYSSKNMFKFAWSGKR